MLGFIRNRATSRKLRLFAVAIAKPFFFLMDDRRSFRALSTAERWADNECSANEVDLARRRAWDAIKDLPEEPFAKVIAARAAARVAESDAYSAALWTQNEIVELWATLKEGKSSDGAHESYWEGRKKGEADVANTLRHLLGNPFRRTFSGVPRSKSITRLAESIYQNGATSARRPRFSQQDVVGKKLGSLRDALFSTGYPDLAAHFTEDTSRSHPKGCWVLDIVLGREPNT